MRVTYLPVLPILRDLYVHRRKNLRGALSSLPSGKLAKAEVDAKAPKPVKKAAAKKPAAKPKSDAINKARAPVTATAKTSPAKAAPAAKTPAKKSAGKARG